MQAAPQHAHSTAASETRTLKQLSASAEALLLLPAQDSNGGKGSQQLVSKTVPLDTTQHFVFQSSINSAVSNRGEQLALQLVSAEQCHNKDSS